MSSLCPREGGDLRRLGAVFLPETPAFAGERRRWAAMGVGVDKPGYVYLLTNKPGGVLYIGVTSDLARRLGQHRARQVAGFSKRYNCSRLVWFERFDDIQSARVFEVRMKNWNRDWKVTRIEQRKPEWRDLSDTLLG